MSVCLQSVEGFKSSGIGKTTLFIVQFSAYLSVFRVGLIGSISQGDWLKKDGDINDKDNRLCSNLNNLSG